jgi:4-amino-4-deoxy-L-arabinose transferase-like glycosyltransferase
MRLVVRLHMARPDWIACIVLVVWAALRLLPGLDHAGMPRWDESLHQAATRGTFAEPLRPHIYTDHLHQRPAADWIFAGVWLHKPPLPFWAGALLLHVTGITPLALRLVSFFADLAVALGLYFLMRRSAGRWLAALAGAGYVSLHFTWLLTQGFQFGDVTDTTLAACLTLSVLALVRAADRSSDRWASVAGAVMGMGYLCKSALALAPLGIAVAFYLLRQHRLAWGLRGRPLFKLLAVFLLVAAPWAIYSALAWPKVYRANAKLIFSHLVQEIEPFVRPIDAVFNELNNVELFPIPVSLAVLAATWMAFRAWASRRSLDLALALWIWGSWIVLSLTPAKVPAHTFGVVPAVLAAIVALVADARRRPVLAAASLATTSAGWLIPWLPSLAKVRELVPSSLPQTRAQAGLAEGLLLACTAMAGVWMLVRLLESPRWLGKVLGHSSGVAAVALLALAAPSAGRNEEKQFLATLGATDYARDVGRALDRGTPERSVAFIKIDRNPDNCSEEHALIFYSGRMAYARAPELKIAATKGYSPYLVSPLAEPFAPVPGVPPHAPWRAYDLAAPLGEPAAVPPGVTPLSLRQRELDLLGIARGPATPERDRWIVVAHTAGPAFEPLTLVFQTRRGREVVSAPLEHVLLDNSKLAQVDWFVLPFLGPRRADVVTITLEDGTPVSLPVER